MKLKIYILLIGLIIFSSVFNSLHFSSYFFLPDYTYLGTALILGLLFVFINQVKNFIKNVRIKVSSIDALVIVLFIYFLISYFLSYEYNFLKQKLFLTLCLILFYIFIRTALYSINEKNYITLSYILIIFGTIQSLYAIFQLIGILPNLFPFKFGGSYGNPGNLSNLLAITATATIVLLITIPLQKKMKFLLIASLLSQLLIIILSQGRAAWIGLITVIFVILWKFYPGKIIRYFNLKTVLITVTILTSFIAYSYFLKPQSANGRIFLYKLSLQQINEHPFFGSGYNSFYSTQHAKQIEYFTKNENDQANAFLASEVVFAFNDYLQMAIEYGLVFLLLFIILIFKIFSIKGNDFIGNYRILLIPILACMLFSYPLQNVTIALIFTLSIALISHFDKTFVSFQLNKLQKYILISLNALAITIISIIASQDFINSFKWKDAYQTSFINEDECLEKYDKIKKHQFNNLSFIHNYGSILYKFNKYNECIEHYEKYRYLCLTTDILNMLGKSYEEINNMNKAEQCYLDAYHLVPHKFNSLYFLFKLQLKNNNLEEATKIAENINKKQIKVYSEEAKNIKTEIRHFLNSHESISYN